MVPDDRSAISDHRDRQHITDPLDSAEPTDRTDPIEPMLPIEAAEPMLPIDSTDPREPIEHSESVDHRDRREELAEVITPSSTTAAAARFLFVAGADVCASESLSHDTFPGTGTGSRSRAVLIDHWGHSRTRRPLGRPGRASRCVPVRSRR